jgi:polysaccharide export outer membrane protein
MKIPAFAPLPLVILLSTTALAQGARQVASVPPVPPPPSSAPHAAGTSTTTSPVPTDYRLVTGDKLRIEVYKDPQLSQSLQIRPDGKITLPLVGDVPAAGRTSTELRDAIATSLKDYITNPTVTVIVVETVPQEIYVMGEVNTPGPQPLKGQVSILQALATAGGFKDFAKTKDIRVLRKTQTGTQTLKFNYKEAMNGDGRTIYLQAGDTIIVP